MTDITLEQRARELLAAACAKTTDSSEAIVRAILLARHFQGYPMTDRELAK